MRKVILSALIVVAAVLVQHGSAFAFAKGEQDCAKCHTINADQAKEVLKGLIPDVKVLDVQPGPINGIWEVAMEAGGKKGILYIDYAKKKVIAGNIFDINKRINFTKESFDKINKVDLSLIPFDKALVMGDKTAKYKVVVFDDPD